jgi:hypothetical protein
MLEMYRGVQVRIKKKDEGQKLGISSDYAPFSPLQASTILLVDGYNVIKSVKSSCPYVTQCV